MRVIADRRASSQRSSSCCQSSELIGRHQPPPTDCLCNGTVGQNSGENRVFRVANSLTWHPFEWLLRASTEPSPPLWRAHERRMAGASAHRSARPLVVLGTRFLGTSVWAAAGAGCAASRGRAGSAAGSFVEWLGGIHLFATGRWRRSPLLSQGRDGTAAAPTLPPRNGLLCLALSVGGTWYSEWTFVRVRTRLFSNSY